MIFGVFRGPFFGGMTKLMGSWAQSFNSWALHILNENKFDKFLGGLSNSFGQEMIFHIQGRTWMPH